MCEQKKRASSRHVASLLCQLEPMREIWFLPFHEQLSTCICIRTERTSCMLKQGLTVPRCICRTYCFHAASLQISHITKQSSQSHLYSRVVPVCWSVLQSMSRGSIQLCFHFGLGKWMIAPWLIVGKTIKKERRGKGDIGRLEKEGERSLDVDTLMILLLLHQK